MDGSENWLRQPSAAVTSTGTYSANLGSAVSVGLGANSQNFSRDANTTSSSGTGSAIPSYGGYSLYAETSGTALGDVFWVKSPIFTYIWNSTRTIRLAMEGNACGTVAVYVVDAATTNFTPILSGATEVFPLPQKTWVYQTTDSNIVSNQLYLTGTATSSSQAGTELNVEYNPDAYSVNNIAVYNPDSSSDYWRFKLLLV